MPYIRKDGLPICKKSGVYSITNLLNGKVYVGSSMSIRGRMHYHRSYLRRGKHDNEILQRSWLLHGEKNFRFDVLEVCDPSIVIEVEQKWIDKLKSADREFGYNLAPVSGSAMAGRNHSAESRKKMSESRKGVIPVAATKAAAEATKGVERTKEVRDKIAAGNTGKKRTEEQIENIKANHWSKRPDAAEIAKRTAEKNRGRKLSMQHRQRISEAGYRRWAQVKEAT